MSSLRLAASAATALLYWSQPIKADSLADIDHVILFMQGMAPSHGLLMLPLSRVYPY